MRLSNLIASSEGATLRGEDREITGITADSRKVGEGFLFVAIPGAQHDGRAFIPNALQRGAAAVLMPADNSGSVRVPSNAPVSFITTPDIRKTLSGVAARFYPRQPEMIAAVTGTSGKTSTAQFMREMWSALGHKAASVGTLGLITPDEKRYGSLTTPDAITLHQMLDEITGKGMTHLAMEASSHGLALHRLDHVRVKIGAFTNLSRDHLDYHETMENYLAAKLRLFANILPEGSAAILNADIAEFDELTRHASARNLKIISYGMKGKDIRLIKAAPHARGQTLSFDLFGKTYEIILPVIGKFQAWNGLCALGAIIASGENESRAASALTKITGVPGRLELAGYAPNGGAVFVDYSHKPDALENVLSALRPHLDAHKGAKLGVVFGCGGNRDKGKRPIMGAIAQRLADWVIVTDDNPRHEDAATIRKEILAGCAPDKNVREIGDRAEAIRTGIEQLGANDILVIAGKGHENGQIIGDQVLPFDDAEVARQALGMSTSHDENEEMNAKTGR